MNIAHCIPHVFTKPQVEFCATYVQLNYGLNKLLWAGLGTKPLYITLCVL